MKKPIVALVFVSFALFVSYSNSLADKPFYEGETITIVAGTKAGDVYDLYARLFAQFMPKYIPGNPNIIVQNMPGAGSMIAANYVYNVANPDGLTIGATLSRSLFRSNHRSQRSKVRLEQIHLARQPGDFE